MAESLNELAVNNFREYLRIPSVHPNVDYDDCVTFLKKLANEIDLTTKVITIVAGKPIVIMTWPGEEPSLPTILLNSHMDVVPVFEEKWTYKPFEAHMDENDDIYARGAQDIKVIGIQYLEAIRRLKLNGIRLRRTIYVSFVPDEEIGGFDGMKKFIQHEEFKTMNVGFALDEGVPSPFDHFAVFYGEKTIWQIHIHCTGPACHGAMLMPNTAGHKIRYMIDKFMDFRQKEWEKYPKNELYFCDEATSINLTKLYGGVQENVVPDKLSAVFDIRIGINTDLTEFEKMLNQWCEEAGGDVQIEYKEKDPYIPPTKIDGTNPYWIAFKTSIDKMDLKIRPVICPGTTDARYVREIDIPALGFTPLRFTKPKLHDHNEYANKKIFLKGIDIYYQVIQAVANV